MHPFTEKSDDEQSDIVQYYVFKGLLSMKVVIFEYCSRYYVLLILFCSAK